MILIMSAWHFLFDSAAARQLDRGETLFRREEPVRAVFLVRKGEVALERPLSDGTSLTLHIASRGRLLAEASLFTDAYHCDAVARGPALVAWVPKPQFLAGMYASSDAAVALFAQSSREVQAQRGRVEILRLRRLADRLDAWLDIHGAPPQGGWIRVAEAIGVTPAALYRELARRRNT